MNVLAVGALINWVTSLSLGVFVLWNNPRQLRNRMYFNLGFWVAFFSFGYFFWQLSATHASAVFWFRLLFTGIVFINVAFLHFVFAFLERTREKKWLLITCYSINGVMAFLNFFGFMYTDLVPKYGYGFWPLPTQLFNVYFVFWVWQVLYGMYWLLKEYLVSELLRRQQIKLFLIGAVVGFAGGATNWPLWWDIPLPPYGNALISVYVGLIGYAILRYKWMDVEVIVKRTLVFAGLVASVVAVVSLVSVGSQDVLARYVEVPRWLSMVFSAVIIATLYPRLYAWLVNVTDRYLFQKKYDYKALLKKFTDEVMVVMDFKRLVDMTVSTLVDTMKLDSCSLLMLNKDTREYELVAGKGINGRVLALKADEPFITFLRETHEPIGQDGEQAKVQFPEAVTARMTQLHARLCLPLHVHEELIGVLCLGKKKSDEEFTADDLDVLHPVSRTLGIAVNNAQLFDELAKTQQEAAQKEKLAVIGTLSAGINHEICNPLGIVKAQCEAFLLDQEDGILVGKSSQELLERTSNIMRGALKQIDRATAITQKLSNFAKPIKDSTKERVSVAHEIDEVLVLVGHDLTIGKIEIVKEIEPGVPEIVVDRRQLQEVLFNLVRNAGQAILPPGTITIRVALHDAMVRIEIADTGTGIPPDKLQKIFDPFFTTKEPGRGTGLGLFIVRQIVERNKGRIVVESTVGKGTTFCLEFPAAKVAVVAA